MRQPFVDDWDFVELLGEGGFGEVRLAMNTKTGRLVAVKCLDKSKMEDTRSAEKEACIHKMLNHPSILKFYGIRSEKSMVYLFLEYASAGELFNWIDPGIGMESSLVRKYFGQLINAVEYLHSIGITHRDIKLENLLLDDHHDLKLGDFGLATLFLSGSKERPMSRRCGSSPYVAPEVLSSSSYRAAPADIWSCGIVLTAMLCGDLPWDVPTLDQPEFLSWSKGLIEHSPWIKMPHVNLRFLKRILHINPSSRYSIADIKNSSWFKQLGPSFGQKTSFTLTNGLAGDSRISISQPEYLARNTNDYSMETTDANLHNPQAFVSSQPFDVRELMFSQLTQGSADCEKNDLFNNLIQTFDRWSTRFEISDVEPEHVFGRVCAILTETKQCWSVGPNRKIIITYINKRRDDVSFHVNQYIKPDKNIVVGLMLMKGSGLNFRRIFKIIKSGFSNVIVKT